ncbi:Pyrroline-5-carboxylate reductase [Paragonimus heterotremus]|uniref:Pyrroline-5-carboxylate reductase n=1 Tax=Paragonimus heterotremus TaxID=100268 RepID=A0A8J4SSN9_9TREM|nr:Pyrroline-5-carboxylate reductase [Paragonimus heterotremus]
MLAVARSLGRFNFLVRTCCMIDFPVNPHASMSTDVQSLLRSKHVGFLGSGQMAQALAQGFLGNGKSAKFGIEYLQTNDVMAKKSDIIFACVKPNIILPALKDITACLNDKLIISIAAGTTLDQIKQVLPSSARLIRIMPNTPCLVQAGTAVYSNGPEVKPDDVQILKALCAPIFNLFEEVPESLINPVSGISGCGPAYMFLIAEALADGGVRMGVPRQLAHKLAVSMMAGSAALMEKTGENPAKLKNDVCSPGGATIAAVHALEEGGVRAAIINAVRAATLRSEELAP